MARRMAIRLASALLLTATGCATQITAVRPLPPEREAEINGSIAGREAQLTVKGSAYDGKDVRLTGNTVRFLVRDPGTSQWLPETEAPLTALQRIEVQDHRRGAANGLAIGAGIGAAVGLAGGAILFAVACPQSESGGCTSGGVAGGIALTGALGAFGIGLLGAAVGAAVGAPRIIEFQDARR